MNELLLVISSACFNALFIPYVGDWVNIYKARIDCFNVIYISHVKSNYEIKYSSIYAIIPIEKWRRALRYCGDDHFQIVLNRIELLEKKMFNPQTPEFTRKVIKEEIIRLRTDIHDYHLKSKE